MKEIEIVDDPDTIKIIVEETRSKILRLLRFRDMTISEMSSILNKNISTVFRHVKKLEKAGLIEIKGERKIHNVPEKMYGRKAKTILLAPESYERSSFIKRFTEKRAIAIKNALQEIGYVVPDDGYIIDLMQYIDEITFTDLERLTRDMDWNNLRALKEILILLNTHPEKIKEMKKKIYKPIN